MEQKAIHELPFTGIEEIFSNFMTNRLYREYAEMLANEILKIHSWASNIHVTIDEERAKKNDPEDFPFLLDGYADIMELNDIIFDYAKASTVGEEKPIPTKWKIYFSSDKDCDSQWIYCGETKLTNKEVFEFGDAIEFCLHDILKSYQDYITAVYLGKPEYMAEAFFAYHRMKGTRFTYGGWKEVKRREKKPVQDVWKVQWSEFYDTRCHDNEVSFETEEEALAFYLIKKDKLDEKYADRSKYKVDETYCREKPSDYKYMSYNDGLDTTYVEIAKTHR